jgi:hypothetical protein
MNQLAHESSRHRGLKVFVLLCALMIVALPAMAARGGNGAGGKGGHSGGGTTGGSGTIAMRMVDPTDAVANYKDQVTFDISTTATSSPYVHLVCTQNGAKVLESWQGFFPTALGNEWFYLGPSPAWQAGAADCTGFLEQYSSKGAWVQLASTGFHVEA